MTGEKRKEKGTCEYIKHDGEPCGRNLYDAEHCIFHSKDIEGKRAEFNEKFWEEFERQKEQEKKYDFTGFVFPGEISFKGKIFEKDVYFWKSKFSGKAIFEEAQFSGGAYFEEANLKRANLKKAILKRADLPGTNLEGADLQGANLQEAKLWGANLQKANLKEANLQKAILQKANLQKANLQEANLQEAKLWGVDLRKANLQEAKLLEADLENSCIKGAYLQGANFENTKVVGIKYNRHARYRGIKLSNCSGSPRFIRFSKDQEYIEDFRSSILRFPLYMLWLILADCGRSFFLWASWAYITTKFFAVKFFSMGPEAFKITNLDFSLDTMLYYSVVTFTTLGFGDVTPRTVEASEWVMAEVIIGYVMLGGLISILANKLARRS